MLMGGFMMFVMFAYLGGVPPVFIEIFGVSPQVFGMLFGINAIGFIGMSQVNPWLVGRYGHHRVMSWAARFSCAAILVLVVVTLTGPFGLLSVFLPIFFAIAASSLIMPNAAVAKKIGRKTLSRPKGPVSVTATRTRIAAQEKRAAQLITR